MARKRTESAIAYYERVEELAFYSLFFLAQSLADESFANPLHLSIVTNGVQSVSGEQVTFPEKAVALGPVRVIPREIPGVTCAAIDLDLPESWNTSEAIHAATVVTEDIVAPPANAIVAWRKDERFIQTHVRKAIEIVDKPSLVRGRGCLRYNWGTRRDRFSSRKVTR